jgi:7-cyano-7-deazaguanine synthase
MARTKIFTNTPAVVLLSGGLDSDVALAVARSRGHLCEALSFDYGQRHRHELEAASRIARHLGAADHRVVKIDLRTIGGSALTADIDVPKDRPDEQIASGIPITYVPARNLIFLSIAIGYAEVAHASHLYLGVNAVDYSGYPDCRRPFINAVERAAMLGTKAGVDGVRLHIHTPLETLSKGEIIRLGLDLGVDFGLTTSCYDPADDGRACGRCDSCRIRARGFAEAGIPDPTPYVPAEVRVVPARAPEPATPS